MLTAVIATSLIATRGSLPPKIYTPTGPGNTPVQTRRPHTNVRSTTYSEAMHLVGRTYPGYTIGPGFTVSSRQSFLPGSFAAQFSLCEYHDTISDAIGFDANGTLVPSVTVSIYSQNQTKEYIVVIDGTVVLPGRLEFSTRRQSGSVDLAVGDVHIPIRMSLDKYRSVHFTVAQTTKSDAILDLKSIQFFPLKKTR